MTVNLYTVATMGFAMVATGLLCIWWAKYGPVKHGGNMLGDIGITQHAIGLLTEKAAREALADPNVGIVEWPTANVTFWCSAKYLRIVRTSAVGGDTHEIHGGWQYMLPAGMYAEWREIGLVAPAYGAGPNIFKRGQ